MSLTLHKWALVLLTWALLKAVLFGFTRLV